LRNFYVRKDKIVSFAVYFSLLNAENRMSAKKILVTGADGFIGSHLTEELVRQGLDVRAFVLYNSFNSWGWLDNSPSEIKNSLDIFSGDIRDPYGVKKAMQCCDLVYHLAALIAIPYSYHSPDTYVDTNVKGTLNIVQAAREIGNVKVVHTSTSEVYGTARFVPITEEHPLQGQSPYSASKIGADQMAMSFYTSFETPVSVIRPFNTYGPRQIARAVIPTIITQLLAGQKKIKLGAISPTRDFNFVRDTVAGFMAVAGSEKSIGEVINIGSNYEVTIGETAKLIAEIMNVDLEIETDEIRLRPEKSEVERLWADNSKAEKLLGWKPKYGGIEGFKKGLTETIEWFSNKENLQQYKAGIYNI
jgi:dTDP-glucose 4,6-dehydratase